MLVVDDDDDVREVTLKRIEALGYVVVEACNGPEAIERCRCGEPVALALIDIVTPGGMSGYDVAERVSKIRPDIQILLTTGYDGEVQNAGPAISARLTVLHKPYNRAKLAFAIAEALAG